MYIYVQYKYAETVLQMTLRGNSRGNLHASQGDYLSQIHWDQTVLKIIRQVGWAAEAVAYGNSRVLVPSDQMILLMARWECWTAVRQWPKTVKSKLNLKEDYHAPVASGQMVLFIVRLGGWAVWAAAKSTQMWVGKWLYAAKEPTNKQA
jgi:hypothetical protein